MIDNYLYHLFYNAPVFKGSCKNQQILKHLFYTEIIRYLKELELQNQQQLIDRLTDFEFEKLTPLFSKYPLLEIFYLVNSLGEYKKEKSAFDELGRLKFDHSIQFQTGITANLVLEKMLEFQKKDPVLSKVLSPNEHKSYFFLSHDIDSLYGSLTQDGLWAVKKGRFDIALKLLTESITQKPGWFNIDLVMKTESEYDFKSTFYWLVNKGKIDERQTNADYDIKNEKLKTTHTAVTENGFENGLHKSISNESFESEIKKAPFNIEGNRYHYLKFKLPQAYKTLENSGLKADASLGFAEHYGFRNNYGYPFHPYNMETGKPHSFIEIPLNVMDGTFQRYMKIPVDKTATTIIDFLEKNRNNSLLSILWHNTFFTNYKYKGYLEEYKKILAYLYDSKFNCVTQKQIIEQFSWKS